MIKLRADWLFKYILKGYSGFTFLVFVFYKDQSEYSEEFIKSFWEHEKIHIQQQVELLFLPQWILYLYFYVRRGYKNNPFELEAYAFETTGRKWFSYGWLDYV